ncbi:MAG: adenosylcobinamide-GDP ribazoletransferase [Eubacteriales bacterium]|nr:adenosylcobinamide-GDP ribazoletransferase [Eubacteriales bacterium]
MRALRALAVAFSMYSRIPMPQFEWGKEDMKYMLCFFPWVGAVIGGCVWLWAMLSAVLGAGWLARCLVGAALPLLITGGFHADGFLDTMDAFCSYQPREKKLEILKDPHIGAFSVLMLAGYGLLYLAAFSEVREPELLAVVCAGFALSRAFSGLGVVSLPSAKKEGLLAWTADSAAKRTVKLALSLQALFCAGFMLYCSLPGGGLALLAAAGSFAYYRHRCRRELGGITGDTAGYFILLCEGWMTAAVALVSLVTP